MSDERLRATIEMRKRLVNMGTVYGWCLAEDDAAALATYRDSLQPVISYLPEQARIRVDAALEVAYQAHNGQRRKSGKCQHACHY